MLDFSAAPTVLLPYCVTGSRSVTMHELAPSKIKTGSVFIAHNGVEGVSGHYEATKDLKSYTAAMRLGRQVVPARAKIGGSSSSTVKYDRYAFKEKWLSEFRWMRTDYIYVWCYAYKKFCVLRSKSRIADGTLLITAVRQDRPREHGILDSHKKAMAAWEHREQRGTKIPTGLEGYVDVSSVRDVLCRLVVTVFTVVKSSRPFSDVASLIKMQEKNGLQLAEGHMATTRSTMTS